MNDLTSLTPQQLRAAADLQERIAGLQAQLGKIFGGSAPAAPAGKRVISAAGKARIAAAARARWAKERSNAKTAKPAMKPKRKLSASARAKIAAIARQRWARVKASGRNRL